MPFQPPEGSNRKKMRKLAEALMFAGFNLRGMRSVIDKFTGGLAITTPKEARRLEQIRTMDEAMTGIPLRKNPPPLFSRLGINRGVEGSPRKGSKFLDVGGSELDNETNRTINLLEDLLSGNDFEKITRRILN